LRELKPTKENKMLLEVYDAAAKNLIDSAATLEKLADGFLFTEGPIWNEAEQCLIFSDIPANTQYRYTNSDGAKVFRQPSHFSNGLTLDQAGRLLACEHQRRRVSRAGANGVETVVDRYQGKRLNSPNDLFVAPDGSIIFSDPHYGLMDGLGGPGEQELAFRGVYRIAPGANEPTLLADDFSAPNGLALSPDGRTLYVDDSIGGHIRAFAVQDDWSVKGGQVLVELKGEDPGVPDGMKLNVDGTIYCTGPGGVWLIAPTGIVLGRILMPEVTANLAWGDSDGCSLYMTASTGLYRLRCRVGGTLPWDGKTK
jgi:gluconolactonase